MNKLAERIAAAQEASKHAIENSTEPALSRVMALSDRRDAHSIDHAAVVLCVSQIQVGPQARKTFTRLDELAADIQQRGQLQPILVRDLGADRYLLLNGERRLRAIRDVLKRETIHARIVDHAYDEQSWRLTQLAENLQREDYVPLDLAREFKSLKEQFGYTDAMLADALHVSRTWVWKMLSLLHAPQAVQTAIEEGRLAATDYINNKAHYSTTTTAPDGARSIDESSFTRETEREPDGGAMQRSVSRIPTVVVPVPAMLEVARLLQQLAAQHGLNPIQLSARPTKKELHAILTTRAVDVLRAAHGALQTDG